MLNLAPTVSGCSPLHKLMFRLSIHIEVSVIVEQIDKASTDAVDLVADHVPEAKTESNPVVSTTTWVDPLPKADDGVNITVAENSIVILINEPPTIVDNEHVF